MNLEIKSQLLLIIRKKAPPARLERALNSPVVSSKVFCLDD